MNNKLFLSFVVGALLILGAVYMVNTIQGRAATSTGAAPAVPVTGASVTDGSVGWRDAGANTRDGAQILTAGSVPMYRDAGASDPSNYQGSGLPVTGGTDEYDGFMDGGASAPWNQKIGR